MAETVEMADGPMDEAAIVEAGVAGVHAQTIIKITPTGIDVRSLRCMAVTLGSGLPVKSYPYCISGHR